MEHFVGLLAKFLSDDTILKTLTSFKASQFSTFFFLDKMIFFLKKKKKKMFHK